MSAFIGPTVTKTTTPAVVARQRRDGEGVPASSSVGVVGAGTPCALRIDPAVYALGAAELSLTILCGGSRAAVRALAGRDAIDALDQAARHIADLRAEAAVRLDTVFTEQHTHRPQCTGVTPARTP